MPGFARVGGGWGCDGVPLAAIAAEVGTPVYVCSALKIFRKISWARSSA